MGSRLKRGLLPWLVILTLMAIGNCIRPNSKGKVDKEKINLIAKKPSLVGIYPHSEEFTKTAAHGKPFLENGENCSSCHGSNLKGGLSQVSCTSCHTNYPHTEEFMKCDDKEGACEHGDQFLSKKNDCYKCHTAFKSEEPKKLATGPTGDKKTCNDCHNYPHMLTNWMKGENHGQQFLVEVQKEGAAPKAEVGPSCMDCHEKESSFRKSFEDVFIPNCKTCHQKEIPLQKPNSPAPSAHYPHSGQFSSTALHGELYFQNKESCTTCHGKKLEGGWAKVSCNDCHTLFPHNEKFAACSDGSTDCEHGQLFLNNQDQCYKCHQKPFSKSTFETAFTAGTKTQCTDCHDYPHTTSNWMLGEKHGHNFLLGQSGIKEKQCQNCHEADSGFRKRNPSSFIPECKKCHQKEVPLQSFAHGVPEHVYPHSEIFTGTALHGEVFFQDQQKCQDCHGEKLDGGKSKISCNDCHQLYPHSETFKKCSSLKEGCAHGETFIKDRDSCNKCHELNSDKPGKLGNTVVKSCQQCHDYPHDISNWTDGNEHGKKFVELWNKSDPHKTPREVSCNDCHAKDSAFRKRHENIAISDCKKCHKVDIPHRRTFIDMQHHENHSDVVEAHFAQCQLCHLDSSLPEPHTVKKYRKLFPENYVIGPIEACVKCHQNERPEEEETLTMSQNPSCLTCHEDDEHVLELDYPLNDEGEKNRGCAMCHDNDRIPTIRNKLRWQRQ